MADEQTSPDAANEQGPVVQENKKKSNKVVKIVVALIVAALVFGGGYTLLKDATFSGSDISTSDLVQETENGMSFKRPDSWTKVNSEDADLAYTEGGKNPDDTDQGMLLSTESLGVDYATLNAQQKEFLGSEFKQQFSDASSLENDTCKKVENVQTGEAAREGYDTSFTIEARCTELANRPAASATIKMVIGVAGEDMHLLALVALDETWDKSSEALNEVLASLRPAN